MEKGVANALLFDVPYAINFENKKVLLRERKRHTARRVASTRCAALSNPDLVGGVPRPRSRGVPLSQVWGYPVPGLGGDTLSKVQGGTLSQVRGVPHLRYRGTPSQVRGGTPSRPGQGGTLGIPQTWDGVPPYLDLGWDNPLPGPGMGYPPPQTWDGVPPLPRPEMDTPPSRKCGQTENITSRHPSDAGGKNVKYCVALP